LGLSFEKLTVTVPVPMDNDEKPPPQE
jgi:hypothetical protein